MKGECEAEEKRKGDRRGWRMKSQVKGEGEGEERRMGV